MMNKTRYPAEIDDDLLEHKGSYRSIHALFFLRDTMCIH
jgi:hypothetical protein